MRLGRFTKTGRNPMSIAVALMVVLTTTLLPQIALANTTADTDIVNVVRVDYLDAGGTQSFAAEASATVTVNLVPAALTASGPPTDVDAKPSLVCLSTNVASGSTSTALYALSANANGDDTYDLAIVDVGTGSGVTNTALSYSLLDYTGAVVSTDPATHLLGSAVIVGYSNATTLLFPGGSLAGFAANDIVIVNGVSYLVTAVSVGTPRSHTNDTQGTAYNIPGTETAEVQGSLTLAAYTTVIINGVNVGGSSAPDFINNDPTGTLAAEQVLVTISVSADAIGAGNGTVDYTLTATDRDGTDETIACTVTFVGTELEITKEARVSADGSTWSAWGTTAGNPGDFIEYRVTVQNTGSDATQVEVTDAVPDYTTLVPDGLNFATVIYNSAGTLTTAPITTAGDNTEDSATASGNAAGTAAASAIYFYLGDGNVGTGSPAGGTMGGADSATITYQVQID